MRLAALLIAFLALALPAQAALVPRPGAGDPRIAVVPYDPTQVVEISAVLGYQLLIQFDDSESIQNVAIGDSLGWQVTPNRKANLLFIKPMDNVPPTDMTVVTNARQYIFSLSVRPAQKGGPMLYALRFEYPPKAPQAAVPAPSAPEPPAPRVVNRDYSYEGSGKLVPARIFDDGHATYFQFGEGADYPAIFALEAGKGETVVNSYMRGGYLVVDELARGFVLRRGSDATHIFNDSWRDAEPGPQSPRPRPARRGCWIFCS